jgi:serine/threonine protein kinase
MSDRPLRPGDVIAGKYRVECVLGEGGMGVVLGARNIKLDEPVAIKVLKPDAASDGDAVARFFREARAAVRMKGVHVAKVLDVGTLDDGTPYMLMERLEGADLSAVIERGVRVPIETAVDYVLQTCEALAEAHALGIVHRDIKPSNLFLTTGVDGSPCIKVLDFGISKATSAIDATRPDFGLTQTQTVMGSPQYMAPEQMRSSRRVDGRTDIWALGTIMHELLTGSPPFEATSMPELFAMILQDPAPRLRDRRPEVPPALDDIVLRCLEKSPEGRPATVLDLARLLAPFASSLSAGAAERVARVAKNIAISSERSIAAVARARETPPSIDAPRTLISAGVAPSAPELSHAHTMPVAGPAVTEAAPPRSRAPLVTAVAVAATLLIGGATAAAVLLTRGHRPYVAVDAGGVSTTTSASLAVDLPPAAIDPAPPATWREPLGAPPDPSSATAGSDAGSTVAPPVPAPSAAALGKRPGPRGAGSGGAGAHSAAPQVPNAAPVRPATTASSRYD